MKHPSAVRRIPIVMLAAWCVGSSATAFAQAPDAQAKETPAVADPTGPPAEPAKDDEANKDEKPEERTEAKAETAQPKKRSYYITKGAGASRDTEPSAYVKTFDKLGLPGTEDLKWLQIGLEQRMRWELRDDDYRQTNLEKDEQFLLRTRLYLGITDIIDPLRFGVEFQDSRQFDSQWPETNSDVDENDFTQAWAELYFKDALGKDTPVSFRAGRMSFDYVDRRFFARNRRRNTTNAYDGFRLRFGEEKTDWQVDMVAVMPVERLLRQPDRSDEERWLFGLVGAWRRWHDVITLEPYYFALDEQRKDPTRADREIHTIGLHGFGLIGKSGFDYDFGFAWQFGSDGANQQRAQYAYSELGYTFDHKWKPRLAVCAVYAGGDHDPNDKISERLDRLFGSGEFISSTDYFTLQNVISPKLRLSAKPSDKVRFETSYGGYWLADDTDAWVTPNLRDKTGNSGDFIGSEVDFMIRYQVHERMEIETGYSYFMPGNFTRNTAYPADDGDYFYVQTTIRL